MNTTLTAAVLDELIAPSPSPSPGPSPAPEPATEPEAIQITQIDNRPTTRSHRIVYVHTQQGKIESHYYPVRGATRAVLFVGGIGPKQESPASNSYPQVAEEMQHRRLGAMRLRFREGRGAGVREVADMAYDIRTALRFLTGEGIKQFALVGPSMATEAMLQAAALEKAITGMVFLSVGKTEISPKMPDSRCRLLIIHGGRDRDVSAIAAKSFHEKASDPKEFLLLPRSTNTLNENSVDVHMRMREWLISWMRN
jgi:pimeloyl-ACP methyl ester carboxylesterase